MVRVIGLTGGIASGKSTVLSLLKNLGAAVIAADEVGHKVYDPGTEAYKQVVSAFGASHIVSLSGSIDRKKLGGLVFGNKEKMKCLTDIVWPEIQKCIESDVQSLRSSRPPPPVIVIEAAVLLEAGWETMCDEIWCTTCRPAIVVQRLMRRNQLTEEEAWARIQSQHGDDERRSRASVTIDTTDTVAAELEPVVLNLWKQRGLDP